MTFRSVTLPQSQQIPNPERPYPLTLRVSSRVHMGGQATHATIHHGVGADVLGC